jgi:hypothetical protein
VAFGNREDCFMLVGGDGNAKLLKENKQILSGCDRFGGGKLCGHWGVQFSGYVIF